VDRIINGDVQMVMNTTVGRQSIKDSHSIRHETVRAGIPYCTTIEAAKVAARAMASRERQGPPRVVSLQEYHARTRGQA
jgi:carbamoyl-phosphate synthase large subunit